MYVCSRTEDCLRCQQGVNLHPNSNSKNPQTTIPLFVSQFTRQCLSIDVPLNVRQGAINVSKCAPKYFSMPPLTHPCCKRVNGTSGKFYMAVKLNDTIHYLVGYKTPWNLSIPPRWFTSYPLGGGGGCMWGPCVLYVGPCILYVGELMFRAG